MTKNQYKENKIRRLEDHIKTIESQHYSFVEYYGGDIDARIYAAEEKKKLLIRSLIIETHLFLEDFIDTLLQIYLLKINRRAKKKTPLEAKIHFDHLFEDGAKFLFGYGAINFKKKIILLRIMGVIGRKLYDDLDSLNKLRDRCGHTWTIDTVVRRRIKRSKPKRYVLEFQGKNLFDPNVMVNFLQKYRGVFLKIVEKTQ